jgi:hypothetical protein
MTYQSSGSFLNCLQDLLDQVSQVLERVLYLFLYLVVMDKLHDGLVQEVLDAL